MDYALFEEKGISGKDWAALVLHVTLTKSVRAIGYSTYQVETDDGIIDCRFLGFNFECKAVFNINKEVALCFGGEVFLQKIRVSGLSLDLGVDGKVGILCDSISMKVNYGGFGVVLGLKIGIILPGVTIKLDFQQLYQDMSSLLTGAAHDFADGWTTGFNGNNTSFDRHIIILWRLDLTAAAQHHFGKDYYAENKNDWWKATDGKVSYGFDGDKTLDNYVKYLTRGMPRRNFGARRLSTSNPHSWWVVEKFHGPPSLPCPNQAICDGRRCKAGNDLSRFLNVQPLIQNNFKQNVTFQIVNVASGRALDVTGCGTENGTNIQLWSRNSTGAQKWDINSDGSIVNPLSGRALDATGGGTGNGTNIQLWSRNGTGAQKWVIHSDGSIVNPQSGRALDASGGGTEDGTNIQLWSRNGTGAQKWRAYLLQ